MGGAGCTQEGKRGGGTCASHPGQLRDPGHSPSGYFVQLGDGPKPLTAEATSSLNTCSDMRRVTHDQGFSTWRGLSVTLITKPIKLNSVPKATHNSEAPSPPSADLTTRQLPFQTLSSRERGGSGSAPRPMWKGCLEAEVRGTSRELRELPVERETGYSCRVKSHVTGPGSGVITEGSIWAATPLKVGTLRGQEGREQLLDEGTA